MLSPFFNSFLLFITITCFQLTTFAQVQIGGDIDGKIIYQTLGHSVSMPKANIFAVGSTIGDVSTNEGRVQIFYWNGVAWVQKGLNIDGEASGDQSGYSVSMSDTNTVAIGAPFNDGSASESGHVRVYRWNGAIWVQKGLDIDGEATGNKSGYSVSMPDTNTVAIGAPLNDGSGSESGHVRVYRWNGVAWVQKGLDIDGEASGNQSGYSVSMPDTNTVAIGAPLNDGNGSESGHVRVYRWSGVAWVQKGLDINGEASYDRSGYSVSMPDSNTIAIGAILNDGNGINSGHVRIFNWNGTNWVQKGLDINGEAPDDRSGGSVSMPDTNIVAIGAYKNDGNGSNSGHVRVFVWNGNSWVQKGLDIDGEALGDASGFSVSMPDSNNLAIGAPNNEENGSFSGQVRAYCFLSYDTIFETACIEYTSPSRKFTWSNSGTYVDTFNCNVFTINLTILNNTSANISPVACDNYTSPSGSYVWTVNGIFQDTIPNAVGCDSIISVNLSVLNSTSASISPTACYGYTSPSGNYRWTTSGNYQDTVPNSVGCDSLIAINLTVNDSSAASIFPVVCESFTSPSGKYTWITSGTYKDTIQNSVGCDSLITINLTVNSNSSVTIAPTVCDIFVSPSSNYTWTTSGTYQDTIANASGCDSLITINLTVNNSSSANVSPTVCQNLISPSGKYNWTTSGTYFDTIPNSVGCDSIITVNLVIQNSKANISPVVCNDFTSPSGNYYWTTSGMYKDTIPNSVGCDSLITINLTVNDSTSAVIHSIVCESYTSPSGKYTWTKSGTYHDTIQNSVGCDSLITINLTVNNKTSATIAPTVCDNYISPSGNNNWSSSGTYQDTIPNAASCDSIITINLTVNQTATSTVSATVCDSYLSPSGNYSWSTTGTYLDTISTTAGCDSIITINLTIDTINTLTTVSNDSLIAADTNATYQWLDCGSNYSAIPGATKRVFKPTLSGNYAVSLDKLSCKDTSACYNIVVTGLHSAKIQREKMTIYPNPSDGLFTIDYPFTNESKVFTVTDINGKVVQEGVINKDKTQLNLSEFVSGIYLLRIEDAVVKLVLN